MKILILLIFIYLLFQLVKIKIKEINIKSEKINNFKFVQISDFHDNRLISLKKLEKSICEFNPEVIFLTGDIISRNTKNTHRIEKLFEIVSKYKCFFVSGNHEFENNLFNIDNLLEKYGILNLKNSSYSLMSGDKKIKIFGEEFRGDNLDKDYEDYNILLVHSPKQFLEKVRPYDLVLSGHKHGGQVRLPFLGQVLDHGPKLFPKYSMGLYKIGETILYIDSGLGQSIYLRILDRVSYTQGTIGGDLY